ncbi:MAG: gliding motility lipoprotein GldH [Bacteroidota bacterium]
MKRTVFLVLVVIHFQACDNHRIYEKNYDLADKTWLSDSVLRFDFELVTIEQPTNLFYNIRNSLSYPFQNLYVKYTLTDTLGQVFREELVNHNLFDVKTGKPFGSGIGDVFDHRIKLLSNYRFENPGKYKIYLQHYMRPDTLKEVISVGVRLERVPVED